MRFIHRVGLLLIASSATLYASACDVCGSAASSSGLGLLPQFSKHFAGIQYNYASSESNHPSLFKENEMEHSAQTYRMVQVWGKYQIAKNIQVFGFLPYISNTNAETAQTTASKGFGDATLMANLSIPLIEKSKTNRLLLAGAGIKFPTGSYTGLANAERNGIPNIQTGSGSWDFLANANYTQKGKTWGYNLDLSYIITTANKEQYKFGNRLNTAAMAFCWLENKNLKIVPQAGGRFEYSLHDYDHYGKKWLNEKTGGTMGFASLGSQFYYKKVGIKAMIHIPVYQNFAAGYVHSNARFESGISLLF